MIFRRTLHNKFTAISNSVCVDDSISTDARWCLWYLLTKPVDWEVRVNDIRRISGWGKGKAYNVVNELITAKYLVISQGRQNGGQFDSVSYDVYDEPFTGSPLPEKREPDKRDTVNREHTKDLEVPRTEEIQNTDSNILVEADFEAFWAAYPKRNGPNPKTKAREKYKQMRKDKVSHETLMDGVNKLAKSRENEDPTFTPQAATWINQRRWEDDCTLDGGENCSEPAALEAVLDKLVAVYYGSVGDRKDTKKLLAKEIAKGATLDVLCEAAKKYKLFCKGPPYEDRSITPAMLENWLKFKWREMDGYEFCTVGPDRIKTVRPKKVNT